MLRSMLQLIAKQF